MKILFVCTGNTCRSPLAQALMQKLLAEKGINADCDSAGLECGFGSDISENSRKIIEEEGIFFTHQTQPVTQKLLDESDLVVCMTSAHKMVLMPYVSREKLYSVKDLTGEEVCDPFGLDINVYRKCADQLKKAAEAILELPVFADNNGGEHS